MVLTFDFSGCGLSQGDYVSLGYYEKDDLSVIIKYIKEKNITTKIAIWGRSMGSVTALLYAFEDPTISCIILDSPFSSLKKLSNELSYKFKIPNFIHSIGFKIIRKSIKKRANFDIKYVYFSFLD